MTKQVNQYDLRTALDRVIEADDLIRTALTQDERINGLLAKAQRILHETGNRIQHMIDAELESSVHNLFGGVDE